MVGIAAAVGVVAAGRDLALVVEQPVEHMRGFAGGRRDHLGVERRVSVGEVRVELDPGFITVMGIDAAGFAAEAAGPKELAIRRYPSLLTALHLPGPYPRAKHP